MAMNLNNILITTDSYKVSMFKQYPRDVVGVYSYIEARSCPLGVDPETVVLGVEYFVKQCLLTPITEEDVMEAEAFWTAHGEPFNTSGWLYIVKQHGGLLPLHIRAVAEGTVIPIHNVLSTIENTDPKVPWLTTWVEPRLLSSVWYMSTVATKSRNIKKRILRYLEKSGTPEAIGFKLHDFGYRGVSSNESAIMGGMAHLVNFMGTDTAIAIYGANKIYNADLKNTGFSIPAAEHSTITAWGRPFEQAAYRNMVEAFGKKDALLAVVSDSYDIFRACEMWVELREVVKASGATVVIRPDSGDPLHVLPRIMNILSDGYDYTVNEKGYRLLNNIRIIWGDGISEETIENILHLMVNVHRWSADNFAFGMGGALLQKHTRDDYGWALKASAVGKDENGVTKWYGISKQPITDAGKTSMAGRVTLYKDAGRGYYSGVQDWERDCLTSVYLNGRLMRNTEFSQVRENAKIS